VNSMNTIASKIARLLKFLLLPEHIARRLWNYGFAFVMGGILVLIAQPLLASFLANAYPTAVWTADRVALGYGYLIYATIILIIVLMGSLLLVILPTVVLELVSMTQEALQRRKDRSASA